MTEIKKVFTKDQKTRFLAVLTIEDHGKLIDLANYKGKSGSDIIRELIRAEHSILLKKGAKFS